MPVQYHWLLLKFQIYWLSVLTIHKNTGIKNYDSPDVHEEAFLCWEKKNGSDLDLLEYGRSKPKRDCSFPLHNMS